MRFFENLSVGRKLAVSAAVAILMMAGLVGAVRWQLDSAGQEQRAERQAVQARRESLVAEIAASQAGFGLRDVLVAQTAEALQAGRAQMAAASAEVAGALAAVERAGGTRPELTRGRETLAAWLAVSHEITELRARLLNRRDQRLFPLMGEYDNAFEAVSSNMEYDLQGDAREEARQRLMTFHNAMNDVRLGIQRFLATADEGQARRVRRAVAQQRVHMRALVSAVQQRMAQDMQRLQQVGENTAVAAIETLDDAEAMERLLRERAAPARQELQSLLDAVVQSMGAEAERRGTAASRAAESVQDMVIWTGLGVALLLVLSGWFTARAIGNPLRRLAADVGRIAEGDTAEVVEGGHRKDEIGRIATALETLRATVARAFAQQQMLEQLPVGVMTADPRDALRITYMNAQNRRMLADVESALPCRASDLAGRPVDCFHPRPDALRLVLNDPGRLPHHERLRLAGEVLDVHASALHDQQGQYIGAMLVWNNVSAQARLADSFEAEVGGVVEAVAAAAGQVQSAAQALSGTAEVSGREADAVADASARAGADVQAVAASAEELAASVAEITRQVADGAAVAQEAAEAAQATDATVQGLAQAAQRIGDVVRLIGDIAGQTNLLALNATIEAARAGEAGKGFAVVASEVKTLASQTAKATEEIAQQIGAIQATTGQAVEALRAIGGTIERMNAVTGAIAAAVEEQGRATQEIARSATQVAEGTAAVTGRIGDVRRAAAETGEASASLLGAANDLTGHAGTLRHRATEFLATVRR